MFDVITIGTATRDVFLTSTAFKVLRDPAHLEKIGFKTGEAECFALGSKIEISEPIFTVGGGAINAATTFKRQGLKTAALIRLGDDLSGQAILNFLKNEDITPIAVTAKNYGTAHSTILLTAAGERTILVYRGASGNLSSQEIPFRKIKSRWVYLAPGQIPLSIIQQIVGYLKKHGIKIAINPSKHYLDSVVKKPEQFLRNFDVVILNREEASYLTGVAYKNDRAIFKKCDGIISGIAVMTDGAHGAKASDGRYLYTAGVFKEKKLVDRTGAGDAFGAGFVAGLISKNDINYALRLASANATAVVEAIGATEGILSKKDLMVNRFKYLDLDVEPL